MRLVFGHTTKAEAAQAFRKANPCVAVYGPGPAGAICKRCRHLIVRRYHHTYYKCALRENTAGPGTDHRLGWPACGRYEPPETE